MTIKPGLQPGRAWREGMGAVKAIDVLYDFNIE